MFKIRNYTKNDKSEVIRLIRETIQAVNIADYSEKQVEAWSNIDINNWDESLVENNVIVAVEEGEIIVGFSDMSPTGYLDRLFVHKDFQRKGIAKLLVKRLENMSSSKNFILTHPKLLSLFFNLLAIEL
ncbi:GNAT family N-acetyltransferase [Enterococcus faecalis]|uniref:GNAT family N-acetyltransferase n=1 Tax=Enterococcus faecalis TaxID=1351 RepID=UPI0021E7CAD2|nr:GNAT family N-acetyltransferase [Enterococcus faecalis]MCV3154260.1 GNAT family N-acetyltransferase [Enterococcus faecalis]